MSHSCHQCGAEIPSTASGAICPACLLEQGKSTSVATEEAPVPMLIGDLQAKFPDLEILEFIGSGGMGGVYKARQPQLDRAVALKIIKIGEEPVQHERFLREGKALALLNHPNIVQVYNSGVNDGLGYFVMEYVDGQSLQQILREEPMAPEEAEDFVLQICEALQYAHDQGITHRDIKPANILIAADGQVKIADFGLAKALEAEPSGFQLTLSQQQVGTPYYMAPEQRMPTASADHRADLYALGVVFYEMLTQRLPIGRVDKPSVHCELDPRVDDLVLAAMDTDPDLRPRSARAMKDRLQEIAQSANRQRIAKEDPTREAKAAGARWQSIRQAAFWTLTSSTLLGLALGGLAMWLFPKQVIAEAILKVTNANLWESEDTPVNTLQGDALLETTARELDLASQWRMDYESTISKLRDQRQITHLPGTDRVRILYEDPDRELAQAVTAKLASGVIQTEGSLYLGKVSLQVNRELHDMKIFHGNQTYIPPTFIETEIKIVTSKNTLYTVIRDLELDKAWGLTEPQSFKKLYQALDVREERGTDLITIEYWDEDPRKAAEVANAIAKSYQQRRMNLEKERSKNALDSLQKQVNAQTGRVEQARLKMLDLAKRHRIIDAGALKNSPSATGDPVTGKGTILMSNMATTHEAKASLAQIKMQLKALDGLDGDELIQSAAKIDTSGETFGTLWKTYHINKDVRQKLMDSGLSEAHPKVREVGKKVDEIYQMLLVAVDDLKKALQAKQEVAEEALTKPKGFEKGADNPVEERRKLADYSEASKDYELQKNMLANMQAKLATEKVDLTMPKVPITIHEEAQPASRRATLPLEQVSAAAVIGVHGPDPTSMVLGMTGLGFAIGLLLLLYPVASSLERKRLSAHAQEFSDPNHS